MMEKIGAVDAQKILDSLKVTTVKMIQNTLEDGLRATVDDMTIYPIINSGSMQSRSTPIPLINRHSDPKDVLLYSTITDDVEDSQNVWVFQDLESDQNIIKFYVGKEFHYDHAKEMRGVNGGGGGKLLVFKLSDPADKASIVPTIYDEK
ncbi:hypothetical protein [Photorhabdus luminescens]|uniref:Uncharacterized protein n=1 Tax=Photorhabdus luminescens subsp. sonorensis TaxID=1173677 RepID=A0A5C4RNI8_PHOLU|nr:hypothetical protein [Photorhabdus luminescens]TNH45339.1 hypothetical protein EP164_01205 [Photorhabdus luminescens subsp. sonorensis]